MPAKADKAPASVSFDATLNKPSKRYGVFNEPDNNDGNPKGIVYIPKQLWDELGAPKSVTVTITPSN